MGLKEEFREAFKPTVNRVQNLIDEFFSLNYSYGIDLKTDIKAVKGLPKAGIENINQILLETIQTGIVDLFESFYKNHDVKVLARYQNSLEIMWETEHTCIHFAPYYSLYDRGGCLFLYPSEKPSEAEVGASVERIRKAFGEYDDQLRHVFVATNICNSSISLEPFTCVDEKQTLLSLSDFCRKYGIISGLDGGKLVIATMNNYYPKVLEIINDWKLDDLSMIDYLVNPIANDKNSTDKKNVVLYSCLSKTSDPSWLKSLYTGLWLNSRIGSLSHIDSSFVISPFIKMNEQLLSSCIKELLGDSYDETFDAYATKDSLGSMRDFLAKNYKLVPYLSSHYVEKETLIDDLVWISKNRNDSFHKGSVDYSVTNENVIERLLNIAKEILYVFGVDGYNRLNAKEKEEIEHKFRHAKMMRTKTIMDRIRINLYE